MKKEKYQPVPVEFKGDTTNYMVYPNGDVLNTNTGRLLKTYIDNAGYKVNTFSVNNKLFKIRTHVLVAHSFLGPRPKNTIVNHKDCNKLNDHVDNLEYISKSQNTKHYYENKKQCDFYNRENYLPDVRVIKESYEIL